MNIIHSLFGRLLAGVLSDRVGTYNVLMIACYLAGIFCLALWIPAANTAAVMAFTILFGMTSGAYIALAAALVVRISPIREIGYRTGLLFFIGAFSGLTASPIAGAILQREDGSYTGMQVFSGAMLLVGSSFILVVRIYKTGPVLRARFWFHFVLYCSICNRLYFSCLGISRFLGGWVFDKTDLG